MNHNKIWLDLSVLMTLILMVASPARSGWQEEWDKVLAAAHKEGTVFASGPPGVAQRRAITEKWAKDFPKIKLRYTAARGSEIVAKVARERRVGIFNWDIILASTNPTVFVYKKINALAPLRDAIIIPDRSDDKNWIHGFNAGFMDRENQFFYAPIGSSGATLGHVNRDCVPEGKFNKASDLKKPDIEGKVAWFDPTRPSSSSRSTWVLSIAQGEEWLKDLYKNHKVTFSRSYRQMADWAVSCNKPVAVGLNSNALMGMWSQGIGKNIKGFGGPGFFKDLNPGGAGGNASIGWYTQAPHPNAAKVFVNWYLSKEFQQHYADVVQANSRRAGTKPGDPNPDNHLLPDKEYFKQNSEDATLGVRKLQAKIKKWGVLR